MDQAVIEIAAALCRAEADAHGSAYALAVNRIKAIARTDDGRLAPRLAEINDILDALDQVVGPAAPRPAYPALPREDDPAGDVEPLHAGDLVILPDGHTCHVTATEGGRGLVDGNWYDREQLIKHTDR